MTTELTKNAPKSFDEMVAAMLKCEQTKGQSVYQHGISVNQYFHDLIDSLKGLYSLPDSKWKIPEWLEDYKDCILNNLHSMEQIEQYLLFHDCGKPYCRTEEGKFPNHAEISAYVWSCVNNDHTIRKLVADDMVLHTANSEEINQKLMEWSTKDACTLLLAALSEIHSNARMFGGIDSVSFKMKWKHLDRRSNIS